MRIRQLTFAAAALVAGACTANVDSSGSTTGALDPAGAASAASDPRTPRPVVLLAALLPEPHGGPDGLAPPAGADPAASGAPGAPIRPAPMLVPFFVPAPDRALDPALDPATAAHPALPTGCVVHHRDAGELPPAGPALTPPKAPPPDGARPEGARPPPPLDTFVSIEGGGALAGKTLRLGDVVFTPGVDLTLSWVAPPAPPAPDGAARPSGAPRALTVLQLAVFAHAPTPPAIHDGAPSIHDAPPPPPLPDAVLECFVADGATRVAVPHALLADVLAGATADDAAAMIALAHFAPPPPRDEHGAPPPPAPGGAAEGAPGIGPADAPAGGPDAGCPMPPLGHGLLARIALQGAPR